MAIWKSLPILTCLQRLALLGQYEIWVRMGAVAVMGAVIHAGSTVHRVHAPSTHSLPVIRACQSPFMPDDQTAEITILSISRTGIRQLKEISPAFSCIWNHRPLPIEQSSPNIDLSQRSYIFVGFILVAHRRAFLLLNGLRDVSSSNPLQKMSIVDPFMLSNIQSVGSGRSVGIGIP